MNLPKLIIQEHCGLKVVRGDLYQGGIKCRVLTQLLAEEIQQKEVVYTGCYYGHSGFALGMAGLFTNKQVTLFLPGPDRSTYIHNQVKMLNNVHCVIVDTTSHQDGTAGEAKQYALEKDAYFLPVGFNYPPFCDRYVEMIRSLEVAPREVWVSGGSGVSAQSLIKAWPQARVNVIDLNVRLNPDFGDTYKIWHIPEMLSEKADHPPLWPSARYYDAKMWQVVRKHASPGALIWNIA